MLDLAACSDPGASAAAGSAPASSAIGVKQFNLSPQQDRVAAAVDPAAAALVPESIKKEAS